MSGEARELAERIMSIKDDKQRWMAIGCAFETFSALKAHSKRTRGAPSKGATGGVDCFRAYECWRLANIIGKSPESRSRLKNRDLIETARYVEELLDIPPHERAFVNDVQSSVSRGKKLLNIDNCWNSIDCEKLRDN